MFTMNHLLWILISIIYISALLFISLKFKFSKKTCCIIAAIISLVSELYKIFTHIELNEAKDGYILGAGYLPLHLCSLIIFLFFYLALSNNEEKSDKIISFIVPIGLIGSLFALLIPTSGVNFKNFPAYQCFIYHSSLIWFSLYMMISKQVKMGTKEYFRNLFLLFALSIIMIWANSILQVYDTNFLYIVRPPMKGLPILNLDNGYFFYLGVLYFTAIVSITLFHSYYLVMDFKNWKMKKKKQ